MWTGKKCIDMVERLKFNNLTMTLYAVICVIEKKSRIDLLRLSILTALLQDESVTNALNNAEESPSFANLRVVSRYMMANFNKRFYNTLPLVVNSLSMLLDARCINIENGEVASNERMECFSVSDKDIQKGKAASKIKKAAPKLLSIAEDVSTKKMVQQLNILI